MTAAHLEFSRAPASDGSLVFGEDTIGAGIDYDAQFAATLPDELAFSGVVRGITGAVFDGSLGDGLTMAAATQYDNRLTRYLHHAVEASHQTAAHAGRLASFDMLTGIKRIRDTSHRWQTATRMTRSPSFASRTAGKTRRVTSSPYQVAARFRVEQSSAMQIASRVAFNKSARHQVAMHVGMATTGWLQTAVRAAVAADGVWQVALSLHTQAADALQIAARMGDRNGRAGRWQVALRVGPGAHPVVVPPVDHICYTPDGHLVFDALTALDGSLLFRCDDDVDEPEVPSQIIVPIRKAYLVVNNISLRRLSDNALIKAESVSLSLDADSWTWNFSASVPGDQLSLVAPTSGPIPVKLNVNGTEVRVQIEKVSRSRVFGSTALSVSGRGINAELDAPYAAMQNFGGYEALTAQQLMAEVLTLNGISLGWALDWQIEDWLVPEGVFNHQGTYISAINAIANSVGAYVQPVFSAKTLAIKHRYPLAPWNWASIVADIELPAAVVTQEGLDWAQKPDYNRVFVSGQGEGVLGQVTRAGTAGDILAPMVTDPLIVDTISARQRGRAVLSDTGNQVAASLNLPVLPETGIILPGKFVQYVDGGVTRRGLVRSVSLSGQLPNVWQSIGVETHV